jgi:hypothetical protein
MLRLPLCLGTLALVAACYSQTPFSYSPTGRGDFLFEAQSVLDTHGAEDFSARTVIRVESFAFLRLDDSVIRGQRGDPGGVMRGTDQGAATETPYLRAYYDHCDVAGQPSLILVITAN